MQRQPPLTERSVAVPCFPNAFKSRRTKGLGTAFPLLCGNPVVVTSACVGCHCSHSKHIAACPVTASSHSAPQ